MSISLAVGISCGLNMLPNSYVEILILKVMALELGALEED
jgi:hypothetical protein